MKRQVPPVLCDRCGSEIVSEADAHVNLRFDASEMLVEATLDHRRCAVARAAYERLERLEVEEFRRTAERLAILARHHDAASIQRLIKKAARLASPARSA
jgi:hypothetical protein